MLICLLLLVASPFFSLIQIGTMMMLWPRELARSLLQTDLEIHV